MLPDGNEEHCVAALTEPWVAHPDHDVVIPDHAIVVANRARLVEGHDFIAGDRIGLIADHDCAITDHVRLIPRRRLRDREPRFHDRLTSTASPATANS